jgi:hypothetical protein
VHTWFLGGKIRTLEERSESCTHVFFWKSAECKRTEKGGLPASTCKGNEQANGDNNEWVRAVANDDEFPADLQERVSRTVGNTQERNGLGSVRPWRRRRERWWSQPKDAGGNRLAFVCVLSEQSLMSFTFDKTTVLRSI